ncbi:hypothetical protein ACFVWI_06950 [Streptomyces antibioticus]|uniref:SCO2584 family spore wall biosynthesis protein n=1 Tax=Streptomyces antibioticus TaxID=1890 RepID=UPI00195FECE6|nr:hypothetical protein [Streptomyces sp. S9]
MTPQVYSGSVPEDVGGTPFPDGWEPDDDHDRGVSDEEFASVVFDEDFVRSAVMHEPTAVERLLAAAEARAEASEAEARRARARGDHYDDPYGHGDYGHDPDLDELDDSDDLDGPYGSSGPYARQVRWHRPVAWMLAVVMGVGMVALAFAAVYRGASSGSRDPVPSPASTGLESGPGASLDAGPDTGLDTGPDAGLDQGSALPPSVSADHSQPPVSAVPRTP